MEASPGWSVRSSTTKAALVNGIWLNVIDRGIPVDFGADDRLEAAAAWRLLSFMPEEDREDTTVGRNTFEVAIR